MQKGWEDDKIMPHLHRPTPTDIIICLYILSNWSQRRARKEVIRVLLTAS